MTEASRPQGYRTPTAVPALVWENPPPSDAWTHGDLDWGVVAVQLRARPGQWARVESPQRVWSSTVANNLQGLATFRPRGSFEAVARRGDLYLRYVGHERDLQ